MMLPNRPEILLLEDAFRELMEAMSPQRRFTEGVSREGSILRWTDGSVDLVDFERVWIFGVGKAAGGLANAASQLVGERLAGGVVICGDSQDDDREDGTADDCRQSFTVANSYDTDVNVTQQNELDKGKIDHTRKVRVTDIIASNYVRQSSAKNNNVDSDENIDRDDKSVEGEIDHTRKLRVSDAVVTSDLSQSTIHESTQPVSGLKFLPGDHPLPKMNSVESTSELIETAKHVTDRDLVLFMITGGASAMLCKPESGISLSEKQSIHTKLLRSGASIHEMNCVRKHLSDVKGGKLIAHFNGAKILNFIVSDVPGDDASTIGSGPTNADPTTCRDAQNVLQKYAIDATPNFVETPKPGEITPPENIWITTPAQSASYLAEILEAKGYQIFVDKQAYRGDVNEVAATIMADIERNVQLPAPIALIYFGESEVHVDGNGSGGRNQHLALLLAISLSKAQFLQKITVLSAGTDGIDGNSDAAGAIITESTVDAALVNELNQSDYLQNFDSNTFFSKLGTILKTGPTGNNLMDIQVILIHN